MKLTIERAVLLKALGHVQAVVERRNTIPILSNVLIQAKGDHARLTATDLDMEIVEEAEARVEREGQATAPAHTLYEIARKLPEGADVSLEIGGDDPRLFLSAGRSKFHLPSLPPGDFPVMPAEDLAVNFSLPAEDLARLIDKTRFAVSTEETRYYLNGIHMHPAEREGRKVLRAVATDGHRLALAEADQPGNAADMPAVIIPRKPIGELRRLLEDLDGDVEMSVSEGKIRFQLGDFTTGDLLRAPFGVSKPMEQQLNAARRDLDLSVDSDELLAVLTAPAPARRGGAFDFNNGWVQIASAATNTADDNPLSITESTTTDGRVCSVGPYGWFCDPPAVDNDVTYYTPPEGGYKGYLDQNRLLGAVPEGLPPLCIDTCTDDCRPPCPVECVKTKFNTRSVALETGTAGVRVAHQFFVNPYNGSDAHPGTRERPWETLKRAEAQVRFLRVQNTDAPDSVKLLEPVQIWIRSFDPSQLEDPKAQMENARYMGFTIDE